MTSTIVGLALFVAVLELARNGSRIARRLDV
jgi:hypothetical protein